MQTLGIGFIGCGRISAVHLEALKKQDVKLVCMADVNLETAQKQAEKYGCERVVTDYRELLALPEVEAVIVCVPTFLHREIVCAAAAAGKHVLCEKPIALTLQDAEAMAAACAAADVRLMVGFVRQYSTEWLKLREIIGSGRLGRPVIWRHACAIRVPHLRWFVDAEKGAGPFVDGCVHDYDFARSIFGEAEWVMASLMTFSEHSTALDTGTAIIHFQSGDELVRSWSWGLPGPNCNSPAWQDVIGPGGALTFATGAEPGVLNVINNDNQPEPVPFEATSGQDWFDRQMADFLACIREKREPFGNGERGLKALEIGLAVLEAGRTHQLVRL